MRATDAGMDGLEQALGRVLTVGARASTVALAIGLIGNFIWPGHAVSQMVLRAGLGVLLLTPVARVVASVVGYVRVRDWWFVLFTVVVLALLIGSFVAAFD
jgi:uncharacterized membrane protein